MICLSRNTIDILKRVCLNKEFLTKKTENKALGLEHYVTVDEELKMKEKRFAGKKCMPQVFKEIAGTD